MFGTYEFGAQPFSIASFKSKSNHIGIEVVQVGGLIEKSKAWAEHHGIFSPYSMREAALM